MQAGVVKMNVLGIGSEAFRLWVFFLCSSAVLCMVNRFVPASGTVFEGEVTKITPYLSYLPVSAKSAHSSAVVHKLIVAISRDSGGWLNQ